MTDFKFKVDEHVRKVGGSYEATGIIKAAFRADDGTARYVFRFDNPPGLLHIYNEEQIKRFEPYYNVGMRADRIVVHNFVSEFMSIYQVERMRQDDEKTNFEIRIGMSSCLPVDFDKAEQLVDAYARAIALARKTWPDCVERKP